MKRLINSDLLSVLILSVLFCACVGRTKPFIPDEMPQLKKEMSRIVVTRERQIAGAGSPVLLIDVGNNIKQNAMMYIKTIDIDGILQKSNVASWPGASIDFMWFNSKVVPPVYCPNTEDNCIVKYWQKPIEKWHGFLAGNIALIQNECSYFNAARGYCPIFVFDEFCPERPYIDFESLFNNEGEHTLIDKNQPCLKNVYLLYGEAAIKQGFNASCNKNKGYSYVFTTGSSTRQEWFDYFDKGKRKRRPKFKEIKSEEFRKMIDNRKISRNVQVIGSLVVGDTIIWDRKPGVVRLGMVWYDGVTFMPNNLKVEAGKIYYIHHTTRMGQGWEIDNSN